MSTPSSRSARVARIVHVLSLAVLVLVTVGSFFGDERPDILYGIAVIAVIGGFATLGRLIITRTGNTIGWIFLGIGAAAALGLPAEGYVQASYETPYVAALPGSDVAGLIASAMPGVAAMTIPMLFLLFPTGRPPSRRWNWVAWLWLTGAILSLGWLFLRPGEIYGEHGHFTIHNPIGIPFIQHLRFLLFENATLFLFASALASITSLVVRYRRSRGEERQQIRWLSFVGAAALGLLVTMNALTLAGAGETPFLVDALWFSFVIVLAFGIPVATALAIFRYRLYDVDVVISKTIVYTGLALFITGAYVAIVVGIGALFGGDRSATTLQIVATAAVALAFEPARQGLQRVANRLVYGRRATPYEVMASFGHRMSVVPSVDDVLPDMAETAALGVGATAARVTLELGDGRDRSFTWPPGESVDGPTLSLSVGHAGERIGQIAIVKPANAPLRPAERALLEDLARNAGPALHNVLLASDLEAKAAELAVQNEEIERSRERLVTARDAQRRRLERELRDGVGSELAKIRDEIGSDVERVETEPENVERSLDDLGAKANAALEELRDVARGIFPPLLIDKGLAAALDALCRKSGQDTRFSVDPSAANARFDPAAENAVYFCCVQAMQNAERHAAGSTIAIELSTDEDGLVFVVRDDGPGFDPSAAPSGEGMQILTDRVAALGGSIAVESTPGRGTTVTGHVPARTLQGATS